MKSSIPKPLSSATGINANKRKTPSSPAGPPTKRVVSNPLAQSTAGPRKPSGFVPTTRKASTSTSSGSGNAPAPSTRAGSSLAASTRRTASTTTTATAGASRVGAARSVVPPARRPPAASTTRTAVGARAGPSRGVSPGMGGSHIGSGMASMVQIKVSCRNGDASWIQLMGRTRMGDWRMSKR
jgi:hypothetical protein